MQIRNIRFVLSGNLGRKAIIELTSGKDSYALTAKRKVSVNFLHFFNHIRLQYSESNLSHISLSKIALTRLFHDLGLFPRELIYFLFIRYVAELKLTENFEFSPELRACHGNETSAIWISRQAQLAGIFSPKRDQDLEWDMFRQIRRPRGYLLSVTETLREGREIKAVEKSYLPNLVPSQIEKVSIPLNMSCSIRIIKDAKVDRMNLVVQDDIAFPVHKFHFHEEVSRPTSLLFSKSGKTFYYKFDNIFENVVDTLTVIPHSSNWYHFLIEGLSCYLQNIEKLIPSPVLLPFESSKNMIEVVKRSSGFDPVFLYPHRRILVSNLQIIQEWRFRERFDFDERISDLGLLVDSLQKLFVLTNDQASLPNLEAKRVIFMSRPIGLFRRLENSHDVLNQFTLAGIEVIEPSELPVDAVANKLNKAQIVISETGAAFTNLLFCRKGTKVIEIQPPGVDTEFWQSFTKNLGLDHYVISASKAWLGLRSSHHIPVEKVHAMVTSLLHRDA